MAFVVRGSTVTLRMFVPIGILSPVTDRLNGVYTFVFTAGSVSGDTGASVIDQAAKYGYNTARITVAFIVSQ